MEHVLDDAGDVKLTLEVQAFSFDTKFKSLDAALKDKTGRSVMAVAIPHKVHIG